MNLRPGQGGSTRPLRYMNNQSARLTFRFGEEFIRQSDSADALAPQHIPSGRALTGCRLQKGPRNSGTPLVERSLLRAISVSRTP